MRADGSVWAWGDNQFGALGNTSIAQAPFQSHVPVQVMDSTGAGFLAGISMIAGGTYHSVALRGSDGTVWAWGQNYHGQLGNGTDTYQVEGQGLTADCTLPVQSGPGVLSGITEIAAGYAYTLALRGADGAVWAWGNNDYGQLGDGTTTHRNLPVRVRNPAGTGFLTGITAIAAGGEHALALGADGTVFAWGQNYSGQLGQGQLGQNQIGAHVDNTRWLLPVPVMSSSGTGVLSGITTLAAGYSHSLAIQGTEGTLWSWGSNYFGQLGSDTDLSQVDQPLPVQVRDATGNSFLVGASAIAGAHGHSVALRASDGTVWAWGNGVDGELGANTPMVSPLPLQVLKDGTGASLVGVVGIGAGGARVHHGLALIGATHTLRAWGYNEFGQVGDDTTQDRFAPVLVEGP